MNVYTEPIIYIIDSDCEYIPKNSHMPIYQAENRISSLNSYIYSSKNKKNGDMFQPFSIKYKASMFYNNELLNICGDIAIGNKEKISIIHEIAYNNNVDISSSKLENYLEAHLTNSYVKDELWSDIDLLFEDICNETYTDRRGIEDVIKFLKAQAKKSEDTIMKLNKGADITR